MQTYDPRMEKTTREELVAESGEIVDRVKPYNAEIKMSAESGWQVTDWRLMNTSGLDVSSARQRLCGRYGYGIPGARHGHAVRRALPTMAAAGCEPGGLGGED